MKKSLYAALSLGLLVAPSTALGQAYPTKPVRFIVGFPPGNTPEQYTAFMQAEIPPSPKERQQS